MNHISRTTIFGAHHQFFWCASFRNSFKMSIKIQFVKENQSHNTTMYDIYINSKLYNVKKQQLLF